MKKFYYIITLCVGVLATYSCASDNSKVADWGQTEYYSNFLWKDYTPVRMEQTLLLELNDDAKSLWKGEIEFELVVKNSDGTFTPTKQVHLYKNGTRCANNHLVVTSSDKEIVVGIEFLEDAPEGCYTMRLNPINKGGLDRIEQIELQNGFNVQKTVVTNPLAVQAICLGILLIALFLAWMLLSRVVLYPNVKFSKISFNYNDGAGDYMKRVGGCYKIICTNQPKRVSVFHKIFIGNIYVEVNPFWEQEMTIMSGSRNNIRLITRGEYILPDESVRKEVFEIKNSNGQKVDIETT